MLKYLAVRNPFQPQIPRKDISDDSQKLGTKYSGIQTQSLGENNESMNSFTTHIRIRISVKSFVA